MFKTITPEMAGIKSENVEKYIRFLNKNGLSMHSVVLSKGENIFGEFYWKPFDADFQHRMYSQTKSYVGIAIGLLQDEGKLNINDRIIDYFPEKLDTPPSVDLKNQTIRDMLVMETSQLAPYWFDTEDKDRTHEYLNSGKTVRPCHTLWDYDSQGSQVLSSLVEKLSGKSLLEYLNEKIFKYLGTFKNAEILKTRNNDSWGDSALICTARDMISFAKLLADGGECNGRQLISKEYVKEATSKQVSNMEGSFDCNATYGYGYQIWIHPKGGFYFNGMGAQLTYAFPEKNLFFSCTSDNQGFASAKDLITSALCEFIVEEMSDTPLPENKSAYQHLKEYASSLELSHISGAETSPFIDEINGKTYICEENQTGITKFRIDFDKKGNGEIVYTNGQGEKVLPFSINKNKFTKFPQLGYSTDHGGTVSSDGYLYNCAVSATFLEDKKIGVRVQVIDRYMGNMSAVIAFSGDEVAVCMSKTAENFFKEYQGTFRGKVEK